jgi:hypothetical protein
MITFFGFMKSPYETGFFLTLETVKIVRPSKRPTVEQFEQIPCCHAAGGIGDSRPQLLEFEPPFRSRRDRRMISGEPFW